MTAITKRIRHWALSGVAAGAIAFWASGVQAAGGAAPQDFDLKAQSLDASLHAVAIATGRAVLAPSPLLAGKQAPALKGHYTPDQAFKALLAGSRLEMSLVGDTVIIKDPPSPGETSEVKDDKSADVVVVTGSHIRGAQPAAPIRNIDRDDIEQSGYAAVGDVVRSLPESYAGGQNPGVQTGAGATNEANQNTTNASSVNLRGLGSDATLVLVDGHRLVPDGLFEAPDISAIPLGAVQRIEVVTDGASALYGSDAVAGVVNFILRKSYDGVEFSQRVGGATEGGGLEQTYGMLGGQSWESGHVLASLEYDRQ
jgi:outer membrane receptor protein involved in Fe transport